jgi:hypothetical protein
MNSKDAFESKWQLIRQESNRWWSLFSEADLDKVEKAPVKRDKYVTMLQVKYGYTREFAIQEVSRRVALLTGEPMPVEPPAKPARKPRSTKPSTAKPSKSRSGRVSAHAR